MLLFFFFKQKTAYELRISDWSSDVCSSDLLLFVLARIVNERDIDLVELLLKQRADDGGLAGTDFACQLHETAVLARAIEQITERFLVARRHVQISRVRGDRERHLLELAKLAVHACEPRRLISGEAVYVSVAPAAGDHHHR